MKGTYFLGNKEFKTDMMNLSKPEKDNVLIKIAACGICGTDVHIYNGGKGSAEVTPPIILGHEFAGEIVAVGDQVDCVQVGDHVTVDPNIYCGKCHFCRNGKKQLCENMKAVGVTQDGGFAEYCIVPQAQCIKLNPEIPLKYGAMVEPLACCLHGIDRTGIRQGDTVCVIGGGAIGLMMVQLAKLAGASKIILSEPVAMRREIAVKVGADLVIDPINEDLQKKLKEYTGTEGVDIVIECVGKIAATRQAFTAAKRGATILLFSVADPNAVYELNVYDVFQKELKIVGSFVNPDTHERAAALIGSGKIILEPIITHSFALDRLEEAIRMQMSSESIKVIIEPANK